jgi:hypothetical protein
MTDSRPESVLRWSIGTGTTYRALADAGRSLGTRSVPKSRSYLADSPHREDRLRVQRNGNRCCGERGHDG